MSEINQAHRLTIGASQVHKIMAYLQHDSLSNGAVSLIETMCRGSDKDIANTYELNTSAMQWGIDHEVEAVELIAAEFGAEAVFYGDNQLRLMAGHEYSNIISALCDAHLIMSDGSIVIPEIKCLDTKNHDYIVSVVGDDAGALAREDWTKYCQVQAQNICAERYYEKPVSSIIVFYDPRSALKKLHYVIVVDADDATTIDCEFRKKLKQRAMLARNLYDSINAEPDQSAVVFDGVMQETKLVIAPTDIVTAELLELGLDAVVTTVAENFGIKIIGGALVGGEVFNCQTQEGRDLAKKFKNQITKIRGTAEKLVDPFYRERYEKYQDAMKIKQGITRGINAIRDHGLQTFNEWEAEQERIQQEVLAAEAEKQRVIAEQAEQVRNAILAKIETFTVSPQDVSSLELIAAKRLQVESVVVDVMFGEFEQQAKEAQIGVLLDLNNAGFELKKTIEEAEKQVRLDAFNVFKAKCDALSDPMHSVEYLESQRFKLFSVTPVESVYGEYIVMVTALQTETVSSLDSVLITSAKQRAIDLAEKLKAEASKKEAEIAVPVIIDVIGSPAPVTTEAIAHENIGYATDPTPIPDNVTIVVDRSFEHDIIAMYATLNPVLHAKVVEAAGKTSEYQASVQKDSFLHNLFDTSKQGKELKAAFIALVK